MKCVCEVCVWCLCSVCVVFVWCLCGVCVVSVWCLCGGCVSCDVPEGNRRCNRAGQYDLDISGPCRSGTLNVASHV